jgi:2-succinyl-5-enolpyruvyl-6-hydroxy-3-cyclohexene-1-carboxylate synthase
LAAALGAGILSEDVLFVSGSLAVREIDTFLTARDGPLLVLGNRGASGIDGIVSTAAGVSLGTGRHVVALVGDLALLHDSNGLAALREPGVRVTVVVMNNDGGGIFHFLPVREHEPAFTPYFVTPQGRDLAHLSALHGLAHERVEGRGEAGGGEGGEGVEGLRAALDRIARTGASGIVEVRTNPEENRRRRDEVTGAIASSAEDALNGEDG